MAIYRYKAFNSKAKSLSGVLQAESEDEAIEKIKSQSLILTHISRENKKKGSASLKAEHLLTFCQDMATLLKAKIPLFQALNICQKRYSTSTGNSIFVYLVDGIKNGQSLSSLLLNFPTVFDPIFISCIQSAESSSRLDNSFQSLYDLLSFKLKLKKDLLAICAYPLTLLIFAFIMTFFLLVGFVPQIADLFEGKTLHPISQAVIGLSNWLNHNMKFFAFSSLISVGSVFLLAKSKKISIIIKNFFIKFSLIKRMANSFNMARLTRLLSLLLSENVSLLMTLSLVKQSFRNSLLFKSLESVEDKILQGQSFSKALSEDKMFDKVFVQMMKIAEESGQLASMTEQAFTIYDLELKKSFDQFKKVLQPTLLFLLATVIGFILLATLLPLTDAANIL